MLDYAIGIAGLSTLCVLWWLFQRGIARLDPSQPGIRGGCSGTGTCGSCGGHDGACSTSGATPEGKTPDRASLAIVEQPPKP